jgi:anti-sigma regulatory factor (Ser/Thr protein kinase)
MGRVLVIGKEGAVSSALRASASGVVPEPEIHLCSSGIEALQLLCKRAFEVVVTDTETSIAEDLALAEAIIAARPGVRVIALGPAATHEDLIAAIRSHVFACFTPPFEVAEVVDMVRAALNVSDWHDGIEVVSGLPHWVTLRVSCHLLTADRLVRFMTEHLTLLPDDERDLLIAAFREMLLNAMEHGAGLDTDKVIEVTAATTQRAIVYHFRDPGAGFDGQAMTRAARSSDPDEVVATALRRAELGLRPGGFGMLIARQVADELVYNERGNEVLLVKHLD